MEDAFVSLSLSAISPGDLSSDDGVDPSFSAPGRTFLTSTPRKAVSHLRQSDTEVVSPVHHSRAAVLSGRERLARRPLGGSTGSSTLVDPPSEQEQPVPQSKQGAKSGGTYTRKGKDKRKKKEDHVGEPGSALVRRVASDSSESHDEGVNSRTANGLRMSPSSHLDTYIRSRLASTSAAVEPATPKPPGAYSTPSSTPAHPSARRRSPALSPATNHVSGVQQVHQAFDKFITGPDGALARAKAASPAPPFTPKTPHPTGFYDFQDPSRASPLSNQPPPSRPSSQSPRSSRSDAASGTPSRGPHHSPQTSPPCLPASGGEEETERNFHHANSRVRWAMNDSGSSASETDHVEPLPRRPRGQPGLASRDQSHFQAENTSLPSLPPSTPPRMASPETSPRRGPLRRDVQKGHHISPTNLPRPEPPLFSPEPFVTRTSTVKNTLSSMMEGSAASQTEVWRVPSPERPRDQPRNVMAPRVTSGTFTDHPDPELLARQLLSTIQSLSHSPSKQPPLPTSNWVRERDRGLRARKREALRQEFDQLKGESEEEAKQRQRILDDYDSARDQELGLVDRIEDLTEAVKLIGPRIARDLETAIARRGSSGLFLFVLAQLVVVLILLRAYPTPPVGYHPALYIPFATARPAPLALSSETIQFFGARSDTGLKEWISVSVEGLIKWAGAIDGWRTPS